MLHFTHTAAMFIFFESWCLTNNALHTVFGESSISLWYLHRLGGLPINGRICDEIVPSVQIFNYEDKQNQRVIPLPMDSCLRLLRA